MLPGREIARQALPRRHVAGAGPLSGLPGPVRSQGRSHALSVPRRVWNLHRNNAQRRTNSRPRPGQPVVSCAGCSLNEPRGGPRSLPGVDADQADDLAGSPDRDERAHRGQRRWKATPQQAPRSKRSYRRSSLPQALLPQIRLQQVSPQPGPLPSGPLQQVSRPNQRRKTPVKGPEFGLLGAPGPLDRGASHRIRPGT